MAIICTEEYGAMMRAAERMEAASKAQSRCAENYTEAVNQYGEHMLLLGIGILSTAVLAAPTTGGAAILLGALITLGLDVTQFKPVADAAKATINADEEYAAAKVAYWEASAAYSKCIDEHQN